MRIIKIVLFLLLILVAGNIYGGQWLLYHDKTIRGQVVESDTGKPIEDAVIVGLWKLTDIIGEGPGGYANVEVVTSARDGRFVIPAWVHFKPWKLIYTTDSLTPEITIFKPGYAVHFSHKIDRAGYPNDYVMTPDEKQKSIEATSISPAKLVKVRTDEERLQNLDNLSSYTDLPDKPYSKKQLKYILIASEIEINNLSDTNRDKAELLKGIHTTKKLYLGDKK